MEYIHEEEEGCGRALALGSIFLGSLGGGLAGGRGGRPLALGLVHLHGLLHHLSLCKIKGFFFVFA